MTAVSTRVRRSGPIQNEDKTYEQDIPTTDDFGGDRDPCVGARFCCGYQIARADNQIGGIGSSRTLTAKVKVKSVNLATRRAVFTDADGNNFALTIAPRVRNLDKVKAGDTIMVRYNLTTTYVVTRRGAATPSDSDFAMASRAAKGERPAGAYLESSVTTDVVLGVDTVRKTLKLSDPKGGHVVTVNVTNPLAQKQLHKVKVGDRVTAHVTESLLVAVDHI